jgi:hypothetical protein
MYERSMKFEVLKRVERVVMDKVFKWSLCGEVMFEIMDRFLDLKQRVFDIGGSGFKHEFTDRNSYNSNPGNTSKVLLLHEFPCVKVTFYHDWNSAFYKRLLGVRHAFIVANNCIK